MAEKGGAGNQTVHPDGGVNDYQTIINGRLGQPKEKAPKGPQKAPGIDVAMQSATLTFCIPHNDHLRGYWDRVEDRLFKSATA